MDHQALSEDQIERIVERTIDRLDRHLLSNQITQEQYDRDIVSLARTFNVSQSHVITTLRARG